jgi:hypothetical protein
LFSRWRFSLFKPYKENTFMNKLLIIALALLFVGSVFADIAAPECYDDSDCYSDEYCNSYDQCVPYSNGGSNCCGTAAILLAAIGLGAFAKYKGMI